MPFDQLKRRQFITLLGGAAAWPLTAHAQKPGVEKRVAVLMNSAATDATVQSLVTAFVQALRPLGWIEGKNIRVDIRWSAGDARWRASMQPS
jgi:putative ABC transport system substrate-binding protein